MPNLDTVLVFLRSNNDIDNISPILYKLGESTSISVRLVFHNVSLIDDFRIQYVRQYDNISINIVNYSSGTVVSNYYSTTGDARKAKTNLIETVKQVGRKMPTALPEKLYSLIAENGSSDGVPNILDELTADSETVLLLFDYLPGEKQPLYDIYTAVIEEARNRGHTTIAVPHGGGVWTNSLLRIDRVEQVTAEGAFETLDASPSELYYHTYQRMDILDYVTIPNEQFRKRFDYFMDESQIKVTGSARYCHEWISVLQDIASIDETGLTNDQYNIVIFLGRSVNYLSKREVLVTINLVSSLPNTTVAVKNHPREKFITDDDELYDGGNVVLADDVGSPHILDWGDMFLNTGTSVVLDCIMRNKPLLDLDYLHSNRSSIVEYMPECEIQTYDELYHTLVKLLTADTLDEFYDQSHRNRYINDIITSDSDDVLKQHLDVFEAVAR